MTRVQKKKLIELSTDLEGQKQALMRLENAIGVKQLEVDNLALQSRCWHKLKVLGKYYNTHIDSITTIYEHAVNNKNLAFLDEITAVIKDGKEYRTITIDGDCSNIFKNGDFELARTYRKYSCREPKDTLTKLSSMTSTTYGKVVGFIRAKLHRYVDGNIEYFEIDPPWM